MLLVALELRPGLGADIGIGVEDAIQGRVQIAGARGGPQQDHDRERVLEVREEEAVADEEASGERVGLEDPAHAHRPCSGLGEARRRHRSDMEVVGGRDGGVDQQLAGGQSRGATAVDHVQVDRLREAPRRDRGERRESTSELELTLVNHGRRRDAGKVRHGGDHRPAESALAADDVAGVDGRVDAIGGRRAERGAEDGDRRHQRDADHQRRGCLGRAARVAHRVLLAQPPGHPERRAERTPKHA